MSSHLVGYSIPKCRTVEDYRAAIENLPLVDSPEAFGLHPNADITYQTNMSKEVSSNSKQNTNLFQSSILFLNTTF